MREIESDRKSRGIEPTQQNKPSLNELFGVRPEEVAALRQAEETEVIASTASEPTTEKKSTLDELRAKIDTDTRPQEKPVEKTEREARVESRSAVKNESVRPSDSGIVLWRATGVLLGGVGALVCVLPQISAAGAQLLENHSALRSQAGTLMLAGTGLFMYSMVRGMLVNLRGSLESMSRETARLKDIAADGAVVRDALRSVVMENASLTREFTRLHTSLKQLIGIVSNPDFTVSIFRLAASVDQLGKQVQTSMKGQFEQIQSKLLAIAENAERAEKQLTSNVTQIPVLMKDQHKSQQSAVQKGFDLLHSAAEESEARLDRSLQSADRIEAAIQSQHEIATEGVARILHSSDRSARELAECLTELRAHIDVLTETHSSTVTEGFVGLDGKLVANDRTRTTEITQLAEQIKRQIAGHVEQLSRTWSALAEIQGNDQRSMAEGIDRLSTRFAECTSEQIASIRDVREETVQATSLAMNELATTLGALGSRLEQRAREQQALVQDASASAREQAEAGQRELTRSMLDLTSQLELLEEQQRNELASFSQTTRDTARTVNEGLAVSLSRLETQIAEQVRGQGDLMVETSRASQLMADATKREIVEWKDRVTESTLTSWQAIEDVKREIVGCKDLVSETALTNGRAAEDVKREIVGCKELVAESTIVNRQVTEDAKREIVACMDLVAESALTNRQAAEDVKHEIVECKELVAETALTNGRMTDDVKLEIIACKGLVAGTAVTNRQTTEEVMRGIAECKILVVEGSQCAQQAAQTVSRELGQCSERVVDTSLSAQHATEVTKRELTECIEHVVTRIEKTLEMRSSDLTTDMLTVASLFNGITAEVRQCISESIRQVGATTVPTVEPPTIEPTLAEPMAMEPTSTDPDPMT